jgi:signal transduction histidine kinase
MSIRLRLTLLYSAILAVTLIASDIALYLAVSGITLGSVQDALTAEIKSYALATQLHPDPDQPGALRLFLPANVLASQDYVQVRRIDGTVLYSSTNLQQLNFTLPLHAPERQHLQPGVPWQSGVSVGGQRMLLATMLLVFHGGGPPNGPPQGTQGNPQSTSEATSHEATPQGTQGAQPPSPYFRGSHFSAYAGAAPPAGPAVGTPVGILQIATSLHGVDQTLTTLREVLVIGGAIVILLACGAGFALAGAALRPITRITQAAEEIGAAQDFDRRVTYVGPPDEVGRLASTFNTMLDRLRAAFLAQRRFVGDASHELRTPLTTIRGNLGLLEREPPIAEADRVAVVGDLVSETERLMRLVGDLLTLARSDAGRPLRQELVPLRPLLANLLRRLAVAYPDRAIAQEGVADVAVLGDPDALTQVLLILLDNALKFTTPEGRVTVVLAAEANHVAISVRDTGTGIAPEALPHIFERFYQGDEARTGRGTGLGLAIAKALVEGQHGTIGVQSEVGRGSTFTVTLPRAATAPQPALVHASTS